jgi:hypothetical protein
LSIKVSVRSEADVWMTVQERIPLGDGLTTVTSRVET